jgi:hypothetical protein
MKDLMTPLKYPEGYIEGLSEEGKKIILAEDILNETIENILSKLSQNDKIIFSNIIDNEKRKRELIALLVNGY